MTSAVTTQSTVNQSATITAFDPTTRVATLSQPVNLSLGYNQNFGDVTTTYNIVGTNYNLSHALTNGGLPQLSTDEQGNFNAIFNVPSNTFQIGTRVFRIDNRLNVGDTNSTSATTYAEATFTASGLQINATQANFAPSLDSSASTYVPTTTINSQSVLGNQTAAFSPFDPIAQSFIVSKDNYPNGVFLSSIKLFFQNKPITNIPITVSIVATLNGVPNGQTLDYSTVTLFPNQVKVSQTPQYLDANTATTFTFNAPVYVQPGVLYAILINSRTSDYTLWYGQQNSSALPSTAKAKPSDPNPSAPTRIGAAPYVGGLFESQNALQWSVDQTKDLMFVIDHCVFNTNITGIIPFNLPYGAPYRKLGINDVRHKNNPAIVSQVMGNYSQVSEIDELNVTTTEFVPTQTKTSYTYQSLLADGTKTATSTIIPGNYATPTYQNIKLNDGLGARFINPNSNSSFVMTATLSSNDPNVSPIISDDGMTLYTITYAINNMGLSNNVIQVLNAGTGYSTNTYATVSAPDVAGGVQAAVGVNLDTNGNVTSVYTQTQGSGYIKTPTITIIDQNNTRGGNANASIVVGGETSSSGGNSRAKYFTKPVILQPGNDSGDLRVYCTAYQPVGTAIYIYYKILSSQDTSTFVSQNWQLMTPTTNANNFANGPDQLIEYEYAPGIFGSGQANNSISYLSTNGTTYNNFIQFAIKVVMASSDSTNIPYLNDIRAIALPPGTRI